MSRDRLPKGKGWFIWSIALTMKGNPVALADAAKKAGIGHVFFHIHDGYLGETKVSYGADLTPYIAAMVAVGVECWGWGAVYRSTWSQGCDRVNEAMAKHPDLVGYILDAEGPIANSPNEAAAIMNKLRYFHPDMPIGLSSYRFPELHPELPWAVFRSKCDFDIPQVYWEQSISSLAGSYQLKQSYGQFQKMTPKLPFVATGPAYKVGGWSPSVEQLQGFFRMAKDELMLSGVDFWVWYQAEANLPVIFELIQSYPWSIDETEPPVYTMEQKVQLLWDIHPELHY